MKVLIQAANGRIQYPVPTLVGLGAVLLYCNNDVVVPA